MTIVYSTVVKFQSIECKDIVNKYEILLFLFTERQAEEER